MSATRALSRAEIAALATVAVCVGMLLVASLASGIDDRMLRGVTIWSKPIKFAASFSLHLATLLIFVRLLGDDRRVDRGAALALVSASVASLVEVLYVSLQSARGRGSHFNTETAFESFKYYVVMGGAALVLVTATALIGILVLRAARSEIDPGLRLGAGWGAILGALTTLMVGGVLASGMLSGNGPWIGEPRTDAGGMAIVGWSRQTGDLRVAHFIGTHLVQAAALVGFLVDRLSRESSREDLCRIAVAAVLALGISLTALTFIQALSGIPLMPAHVAPTTPVHRVIS